MKPFKHWIDIPKAKSGGRYFSTIDDYNNYEINSRIEVKLVPIAHENPVVKMSELQKKTVMPFIEKYLCYMKGSYNTSKDFYGKYKEFCGANKYTPLAPSTFGVCIKSYIVSNNIQGALISTPDRSNPTIGYYNVGMKE